MTASIAPGAVTFGDRGEICVRARDFHVSSVDVLGADDGWRARASLGVAVDAWRSARASVVQSMSSRGSASLDQLSSTGSSLLQQCHSSVASFTAAVGSPCLASHVHCDTARHWLGAVKNFPAVLYCFAYYRRARRCASRMGRICPPSLKRTIIIASPCMLPSFTIRCAQMLYTGMLWFLTRISWPIFWDLGFRLWPLSPNPNFA